MKNITLEILKRNPLGNMERRMVDITGLNEVLTPEEIFMMEFKINEIPSIRAHISIRDDSNTIINRVPNPEFCRSKDICGRTGKCEAIRKYDRSCND